MHSRCSFQASRISRKRMDGLSERESEVLNYSIEGLPNKIIARETGLPTRTIESHRARILDKLEVESLAALIRTAVLAESVEPA